MKTLKTFGVILFLAAILFAFFVFTKESRQPESSSKSLQYFSLPLDVPSPEQRNIFFLETSCATDGSPPADFTYESGVNLSVRAACAVEAAARANPDRPVYLAYTCPVQKELDRAAAEPHVVQALSFPNVRLWPLNMDALFTGSPLQGLYDGPLRRSAHPVEHASDLTRLLVLLKYGGTYLDTDMFLVRPLGDLKNFLCSQEPKLINNAVMDFALDDVGRPALRALVAEIQKKFDPNIYHIGPIHATSAFMKYCGKKKFDQKKVEDCRGFHILNAAYFYPVILDEWYRFFEEKNAEETMKMINASNGAHVWNKRNMKYPEKNIVYLGSDQPYAQMARQVCPNVVSVAPDVI